MHSTKTWNRIGCGMAPNPAQQGYELSKSDYE